MKFINFNKNSVKKTFCILTKDIKESLIRKYIAEPFKLNLDEILVLSLVQEVDKKTSVKFIKQVLQEEYQSIFDEQGCDYIICTDAVYFHALTKCTKTTALLGYVLPSVFGRQKVIYCPSLQKVFYDPNKVISQINQAISALLSHINGVYKDPGSSIITTAMYPQNIAEIKTWLDKLLSMNQPLTCDIECFDLKHYKAGIATITFCWNQHEGIAFPVDYRPSEDGLFGSNTPNEEVRELLRNFFINFKETLIFHNISFDVYVLVYQLFMKDLLDTEGMYEGFKHLLKNWDDTLLITYLATNSCAGNELSLKSLAQEFSGNYAQEEIKDITKISLDTLLKYNLTDGLSTWYVYNKFYSIMVKDNQEELYKTLFKDCIIDIIQMQLTGLPLNMERVLEVENYLNKLLIESQNKLNNSNIIIKEFMELYTQNYVDEKNATYKKKRITVNDVSLEFNINSDKQLQQFLFDFLKLPILETTPTKQPATGGEILENLQNHIDDLEIKNILDAMIKIKKIEKILSTFIPVMKDCPEASNGWHYLYGNYNLGGTVSGRLSSSKPNLQNLPSNSTYGKLIKSCFQAPKGWLLVGLDFSSLEDRISALTTKDPNKLKVYIDKYDGHSLRAYSYFRDQMSDIDPTSVDSINSISKKYPKLRQSSKAPTFALTYGGTFITLIKNCGFSEEEAKQIESRYHELYKVSDNWVNEKLNQASKDGYITAAFGLRVRTPKLSQVIRNNSKTPYEAEAEGRTAGNALGQSWCMLNSRAWAATMKQVRNSQYAFQILLSAQIHDAGYVVIKDDVDVISYLHAILIKEVNWNNHPDIYHGVVGLGGELSIFHPTWANEIVIPNEIQNSESLINYIKENYNGS